MPSPPVREDLELIEELAARRGPFGGQLVDVETGQPIACATVAAVWWDQYPLGLKFYDAREAISGEDGRFEIPRLDIPLTKLSVGAPQLHFLAPGYLPPGYYTTPGEPASAAHIIRYRVTPPEGQPFVAPTVVPMRRIRTGEEWCDYKHAATLSVMVPTDKIPRYREVLRNEEPSHGPCR